MVMVLGKASVLPTRQRRHAVLNTLALLGGLCLIVVAQFVLFPLLFTMLVDDPRVAFRGRQRDPSSYVALSSSSSSSLSTSLAGFASSGGASGNRRRRVRIERPPSNGAFNGAPLYLKTMQNPSSRVHCVGENYRRDAWKHRSCRFSLLCFNTTDRQFLTFQAPHERLLSVYMAQRPHMHSSTTQLRYGANRTNSVSIGGINQKWGEDGISRLEWFPRIVHHDDHEVNVTYYELPDDVVLVPFHSLNGANPGHLVWDDFLPIYTLLNMFQLLPSLSNGYRRRDILPLRYVLEDGQKGLWASCDMREEKTQDCRRMMDKFGPLLLGKDSPFNFTSTRDFDFRPSPGTSVTSDLVCAKTAAAGIGSLTDHGAVKSHGWDEYDYLLTHNHGRGGLLYDFRNFLLENLGLPPAAMEDTVPPGGPHRIVFSQRSSDIVVRNLDFRRQLEMVRNYFPQHSVENYVFKELSVPEQLDVARQTSVYVTLCGGGAVTAMFLPRGSSLIVFYSEDSGFDTLTGKPTGKPALLDWDLLNSMSHLRVHWLPRNTMGGRIDERALVLLIQQELDIIDSQAFS